MLRILRDLIAHKHYADAAALSALRHHDTAVSDPVMREAFQHMLISNRFWLLTVLGLPFDADDERRAAESFDGLIRRFIDTQKQEIAWLATATEADLGRIIENSRFPGGRCSVWEAMTQVCLHSQGHRSQAAKLFRQHGGAFPTTDFILWVVTRAMPEWPDQPEVSQCGL